MLASMSFKFQSIITVIVMLEDFDLSTFPLMVVSILIF
jgi:hypothetical protein